MKLLFEGTDIYPEVSINSAIHNMYASNQSDSLVIRFNDTRRLWDIWQPKAQQTIAIELDNANTGKMVIDSIKPENALFTLTALSCPTSGYDANNKAWEDVRFSQLIQEIASRNGLTVEQIGIEDRLYKYVKQDNISDFAFLHERCIFESCAFLVFNGKLVVYSQPFLESQQPVETISITQDSQFSFQDNSGWQYGSAEIYSGNFLGNYKANVGKRNLKRVLNVHTSDKGEADRFAKGILRNENINWFKGSLCCNLKPNLAPGSVININYNSSCSGNFFLYAIRHDYTNFKSKLFFRKPLEGY